MSRVRSHNRSLSVDNVRSGNRLDMAGFYRVGSNPDVVRFAPPVRFQMFGSHFFIIVNAGSDQNHLASL